MRLVFLAGLVLSAGVAFSQPAFEVASIKFSSLPSRADAQAGRLHVGMTIDGQRVDIGFMSLRDLIMTGYRMKPYQIVGPDWMIGQRFDVLAKIPDGSSRDQVPEMLQGLLAERFKLAVHREKREHAVYALLVGKSGPKLKEAEPDAAAATERQSGASGAGVPVNRDSQGAFLVNGRNGPAKMQMGQNGMMHVEFARMSMAGLADMASAFVDGPVMDLTGLKGNYQVALDLATEDMLNIARAAGIPAMSTNAPTAGGRNAGGVPTAPDPSGSSIFQSVQALGLKLEARKAPLETIVVDHVEKRPTEN